MQLGLQVRLYPNKIMQNVLDSLCDYRRYCWNHGLELWNDLYEQRVEIVPASLRKKSQLAIEDKTIDFSKEEKEILDMFPSPSERVVRDLMVKDKEDWQYLLSSKVLQLAARDLAQAWSKFFDSKESKQKVGKPSFQTKKNPKQGFKTYGARIKNGKLVLDKPWAYKGDWYGIPFKGYELLDGKIKHCSVTKINNKYYASLAIDTSIEPLPKTGKKQLSTLMSTISIILMAHLQYALNNWMFCMNKSNIINACLQESVE